MKDKDSGWVEPTITINGHALTFAQAMSVRVAVSSMRISLSDERMRTELGPIAKSYDVQLASVEELILNIRGTR